MQGMIAIDGFLMVGVTFLLCTEIKFLTVS